MASSHFPLPNDITSLLLLLIISIPTTHSQNIGISSTDATVAECGPNLMMLTPCAPFVQGTASLPTLSCCGNLREFLQEDEDLRCLCLLLNDPSLGTVPVNRTLALHLPNLCNLQANISTCSGLPVPDPAIPSSPTSQVTFQTITNSTAAASPVATVAPSIMGFNTQNIGTKLNAENHIAMTLLTAIVFLGRI